MMRRLSPLVDEFSRRLDSEAHQNPMAPHFSEKMANSLTIQHATLANPSLQARDIAEAIYSLLEFESGAGSDGQRLNCQYLLARCSFQQHINRFTRRQTTRPIERSDEPVQALSDPELAHTLDTAIGHFNAAIDLAKALSDDESLVALHYWLAKCYHQKSDHDSAYSEYALAEDVRAGIPSTRFSANALLAMCFTLHLRMGSHDWERGHFDSGERHISEARRILTLAQETSSLNQDMLVAENILEEAFQVYWITSLLDFVGGRFIQAYRSSLLARDALSANTNPTNMGRCLRLVAEYRMNLVAAQCRFDPVDYPAFRLPGIVQDSVEALDRTDEFEITTLMGHVHKELKEAIAYARQGGDSAGRALVELAMRRAAHLTTLIKRLDSATSSSSMTLEVAERIANQARDKQDASLLGRALMTRGNALVMQNDYGGAYCAYAEALVVFRTHRLYGLSFWPRQMFRALRYMRPEAKRRKQSTS